MFGVLLTVKGSSTVALYKPQLSGSGGNKKGQQDRPIPLPLAPGMGRIPSLPISSKAADSGLHHKVVSSSSPTLPKSAWYLFAIETVNRFFPKNVINVAVVVMLSLLKYLFLFCLDHKTPGTQLALFFCILCTTDNFIFPSPIDFLMSIATFIVYSTLL